VAEVSREQHSADNGEWASRVLRSLKQWDETMPQVYGQRPAPAILGRQKAGADRRLDSLGPGGIVLLIPLSEAEALERWYQL
jgi:hypothetical protein